MEINKYLKYGVLSLGLAAGCGVETREAEIVTGMRTSSQDGDSLFYTMLVVDPAQADSSRRGLKSSARVMLDRLSVMAENVDTQALLERAYAPGDTIEYDVMREYTSNARLLSQENIRKN